MFSSGSFETPGLQHRQRWNQWPFPGRSRPQEPSLLAQYLDFLSSQHRRGQQEARILHVLICNRKSAVRAAGDRAPAAVASGVTGGEQRVHLTRCVEPAPLLGVASRFCFRREHCRSQKNESFWVRDDPVSDLRVKRIVSQTYCALKYKLKRVMDAIFFLRQTVHKTVKRLVIYCPGSIFQIIIITTTSIAQLC